MVASADGRRSWGNVAFMAVDSETSLVGGRTNWAMPKTLAQFRDLIRHPLGQRRIDQPGQSRDGLHGDVAIARNVVAAHDGEGLDAGGATAEKTSGCPRASSYSVESFAAASSAARDAEV